MRNLLRSTFALAIIACFSSACGPPELCQQDGKGSFSSFRQNTWTPYCADLEQRLQNPLNYELILLTEFFSEYPEQQRTMTTTLEGFTEHEKCFASQSDKLEYRKLNKCLSDSDVQARIKRAWSVRAEPWLEGYEQRIDALTLSLEESEKEADYILGKIKQHERLHSPPELNSIKKFSDLLDDMQSEVDAIDRAKMDYERLKGASMSYQDLSDHIDSTVNDSIVKMFDKHDKNRFSIAKLRNKERFFEYALPALGTPCTTSLKANKETRLAKRALGEKQKDINASKIIAVDDKISSTTNEEDGTTTESFSGYICGKRHIDNQFPDYFELCSKYNYVISRTKAKDARRFGDWSVTLFEEGPAEDGIDCAMLEGPLKK